MITTINNKTEITFQIKRTESIKNIPITYKFKSGELILETSSRKLFVALTDNCHKDELVPITNDIDLDPYNYDDVINKLNSRIDSLEKELKELSKQIKKDNKPKTTKKKDEQGTKK